MSYEKFCALIDQVYSQGNLPDTDSKYENANFCFLDIPITLAHGGKDVPNVLFLFCDFGEPPQENQHLVWEKILEINMELFKQNAGQFAINPESGHLLLMVRLPLDEIEVSSCVGVFSTYAGIATEWRQTYFLTERKDVEDILNALLLSTDETS